jgi:hypothetical protein
VSFALGIEGDIAINCTTISNTTDFNVAFNVAICFSSVNELSSGHT